MRVVIVSGIWPPDPGGPASHAPALADFLADRGHEVEVVTTADSEPAPRRYPVRWSERRSPFRHVRAAALVRSAARGADVVYATSMIRRAALGARAARRPLVVKLVSDEAFERATRGGRYSGTLDEFQATGGVRTRLLRATRTAALKRARHVFCPSAYLRRVALGWGLEPERVSVLPNPAPDVPQMAPRDELRRELELDGNVLVFAGRLGPQKAVGVLLVALADVDGVSLVIAGDGPERAALERRAAELARLDGRVRFLGSVPRETVLRLFRAADASVLPSAWENFPHTVVEALAVGCPVIATSVGGVPEVVRDGENGLLVAPNDASALREAIERFFTDAALRQRLVAAAPASVAGYSEETVFSTIEAELERAASR